MLFVLRTVYIITTTGVARHAQCPTWCCVIIPIQIFFKIYGKVYYVTL